MIIQDPDTQIGNFIRENNDLIFIDHKIVPSVPINKEEMERWINQHKEGIPRVMATVFAEYTEHISFDTFKSKIYKMGAEINLLKDKYTSITLFLQDAPKKSNFWMALLLYTIIKPHFVCTEAYDASKIPPNTLFIVPDDAAYSGAQIEYQIPTVRRSDITIFMAIPYMTIRAMKRIQTRKRHAYEILYPQCMTIMKSFRENLEEYITQNIQHLPFNIETYTDTFKDLYSSVLDNLDRYTFYFDHKLADEVSIFQLVYYAGYSFFDRNNDLASKYFTYRGKGLLENCNQEPLDDIHSSWEYDVAKHIGSATMCPLPFYKSMLYQWKGQPFTTVDVFDEEIMEVLEHRHFMTVDPRPQDYSDYESESEDD